MEVAPLIKAYDHAKASNHICAAGEFANAATHTSSAEALRTLKLLEDHHRRIHELVRDTPQHSEATDDDQGAGDDTTTDASLADREEESNPPDRTGPKDDVFSSSAAGRHRQPQQPPQLAPSPSSGAGAKTPALASSLAQKRMILPQRDPKSSIASSLASARGIRSKQRANALALGISNEQAPGNFDVPPRVTDLGTWAGPRQGAADAQRLSSQGGSRTTTLVASQAPAASDDGYSRFYNNFSSFLGRISAPLAFAGLPLISEETSQPEKDRSPSSSRHSGSSGGSGGSGKLSRSYSTVIEPELSKIYSKATLRAIARDHPPQDSFYIVPTSGHTVSYANILTRAEKEKRRREASASARSQPNKDDDDDDDGGDDDFVDARETLAAVAAGHPPAAPSPGAKRRAGRARTEKELNNTIEELYVENKTLKDLIDNLSKRLHLFEASSQNSHMALAESMRLMRPGSPVSVGSGGGPGVGARINSGGGSSGSRAIGAGGDDALIKRVQQLEEQLALAMRDNEKKQRTLLKYREKWEVLKAGAKARREAQGVSTESTEE